MTIERVWATLARVRFLAIGLGLTLVLAASATSAQVPAPVDPGVDPSEVAERIDRRDDQDEEADADPASTEAIDRAQPSTDAPTEDGVDTIGQTLRGLGDGLGPGARPHARIVWRSEWPRYRTDELVLTAGLGLVVLLAEILPTRADALWTGDTDLDVAVQRPLGLNDASARAAIAGAGDALAIAMVAWPLVIDSLLYVGLGEGAWDVAWQLSLISLEVFAITQTLTAMVKLLTRRERPLGQYCRTRSDYAAADEVCGDQPPSESFWAGHVAHAFAGAALVCMHHDVLDLFGDPATDGLYCATAVGAATATAFFRIMSDRNWASDVIAGAIVGSATGILVPWIMHFMGGGQAPQPGTPAIAVMPSVDPEGLRLNAVGVF